MSVYKRPGQQEYSFDFRYRRQRFSGPTGCTSKREAEKFEEAERKRVKALQFDASKPINFKAACAQYWNEVGSHHQNSDDTLRSLDWLEETIGAATMLSDISDATIARAVAKRRGEAVSNATVNRTVCQPLRALLRRGRRIWKQQTQEIEWTAHFLPEAQERVREATRDEEAIALDKTRDDYVPPIRFAFLTGCRRGEIVGLEWSRVDFFSREFTVIGKRGKRRTIPMTDATFELLWSLKNDHSMRVFTYIVRRPREGQVKGQRAPITDAGFKTEWRRRGRKHLVDFRFHDTRHTALTRLVRATGNLKLAQRLAGHTELATTSRYAHVTKDDLRAGLAAVEASPPPLKKAADNAE